MSKSCGGACGGDATSAADTDIQASSEAPGRWVSVYAVPKMDCPSEERMIRLGKVRISRSFLPRLTR